MSDAPPADVVDVAALYEKVRHKPLAVDTVRLAGNTRTQPHVILAELAGVHDAATAEELVEALADAAERLRALELFAGVDILADAPASGEAGKADITVTVVERPLVSLHSGAYVQARGPCCAVASLHMRTSLIFCVAFARQGEEGSVEARAKLTNPLGYGEGVEASTEAGAGWRSFALLAHQRRASLPPFLGGGPAAVEARAEREHRRDRVASCSFAERAQGASACVRFGPSQAFSVEYVLSLRTLDAAGGAAFSRGGARPAAAATCAASRPVLAFCAPSVLSSLRATAVTDTRASHAAAPGVVATGYAARATLELAGLGPSSWARFLKADAAATIALPLLPRGGAALHLSARVGVLLSPSQLSTRASCAGPSIVDRFTLGGGATVRGFDDHSAGPSAPRRPTYYPSPHGSSHDASSPSSAVAAGRDYLGGDLLLCATAAVAAPLPRYFDFARKAGLHAQAFVDVGALLPLSRRPAPMSPAASHAPPAATAAAAAAAAAAARSRGGCGDTTGPLSIDALLRSVRVGCGIGLAVPTVFGRAELSYCATLRAADTDKVKHGLAFTLRGYAAVK